MPANCFVVVVHALADEQVQSGIANMGSVAGRATYSSQSSYRYSSRYSSQSSSRRSAFELEDDGSVKVG